MDAMEGNLRYATLEILSNRECHAMNQFGFVAISIGIIYIVWIAEILFSDKSIDSVKCEIRYEIKMRCKFTAT